MAMTNCPTFERLGPSSSTSDQNQLANSIRPQSCYPTLPVNDRNDLL